MREVGDRGSDGEEVQRRGSQSAERFSTSPDHKTKGAVSKKAPLGEEERKALFSSQLQSTGKRTNWGKVKVFN